MENVCKAESRDGTVIAYRRTGAGRPLVLVGGAFGTAATAAPLGALLARQFQVITYDRRGRGDSGDSGDTRPYAVEREIEDLAALLAAAGGAASLFGVSSGGCLVLEAAAAGLPVTQLAVYEPPYLGDPADTAVRAEHSRRLAGLLAHGEREEAVALVLTTVGVTRQECAALRCTPEWQGLVALAPTLAYDDALQGSGLVPTGRLARIGVRAMVVDGGASPETWRNGARAVARCLPRGRHRTLTGQTHAVAPHVLAPVLAEFFAG